MTRTAKLFAFGVTALAVGLPGGAYATNVWAKLDVPGYSPGDTAYLCSDSSQFFAQALGRSDNGAPICFQQSYNNGTWVIDSGWCDGSTGVSAHLRAGFAKVGPLFCSSGTAGWNTVISCSANMTLRQNSPNASCVPKTATGSGFLGT